MLQYFRLRYLHLLLNGLPRYVVVPLMILLASLLAYKQIEIQKAHRPPTPEPEFLY